MNERLPGIIAVSSIFFCMRAALHRDRLRALAPAGREHRRVAPSCPRYAGCLSPNRARRARRRWRAGAQGDLPGRGEKRACKLPSLGPLLSSPSYTSFRLPPACVVTPSVLHERLAISMCSPIASPQRAISADRGMTHGCGGIPLDERLLSQNSPRVSLVRGDVSEVTFQESVFKGKNPTRCPGVRVGTVSLSERAVSERMILFCSDLQRGYQIDSAETPSDRP